MFFKGIILLFIQVLGYKCMSTKYNKRIDNEQVLIIIYGGVGKRSLGRVLSPR